jgi:hypothetical protein
MNLVQNVHDLFDEAVELLPKNERSKKILQDRAEKKRAEEEAAEIERKEKARKDAEKKSR